MNEAIAFRSHRKWQLHRVAALHFDDLAESLVLYEAPDPVHQRTDKVLQAGAEREVGTELIGSLPRPA